MKNEIRDMTPHAFAYGLVALIVIAGSIIIFGAFVVINAWLSQDFERIAFATMLLVGLPLMLLFEFCSEALSRKTNIPTKRLEYLRNAFLFGGFMALGTFEENQARNFLRFIANVFLYGAVIGLIAIAWEKSVAWYKNRKGQSALD